MNHRFVASAALCALFTAGCATPAFLERYGWPLAPAAHEPTPQPHPDSVQAAPAAAGGDLGRAAEVPLLGWDGGVVQSSEPGAVVAGGAPSRTLGPSAEGRMHILELYSQVLDQRDALSDEVAALESALEAARLRLDAFEGEQGSLSDSMRTLEAERDRLLAENRELAARLTTAQIRRLEAEKLLLETRIGELRGRPRKGATQSARKAQAPSTGDEEPQR